MVVICWKISIFAPAKTTSCAKGYVMNRLWFAEKLVSLHQQKQPRCSSWRHSTVVICWKISIFAPAKTTAIGVILIIASLWFAEKLVSLHQQKQQLLRLFASPLVVICWKISIFAPAKTTWTLKRLAVSRLWFAEKLVSLHQQKQQMCASHNTNICCDLLKN